MKQDIAFGRTLREPGVKGALKRIPPRGVVSAVKKAKAGVAR